MCFIRSDRIDTRSIEKEKKVLLFFLYNFIEGKGFMDKKTKLVLIVSILGLLIQKILYM